MEQDPYNDLLTETFDEATFLNLEQIQLNEMLPEIKMNELH